MDARMKRHGDVTVIEILGSLSIEQTQPFRDACLRHLVGKKVVFNMAKANFVGSTGLQAFLETITAFEKAADHAVRIVSARSEFRRLFLSLESNKIEFHEDESSALKEWPSLCVTGLSGHSVLD